MNRVNYAGLMYSQPSFLEGFARVLDLGGVFDECNDSPSDAEADRLALLADWYAVGADLLDATQAYRSRVDSQPSSPDHVRSR